MRLLREGGSPVSAERALRAAGFAGLPFDAEGSLETMARLGVRALPFGSPAYPARLARLDDPAPLLWVRGEVQGLHGRGVAVVGPRAATVYGRCIARDLGRELTVRGLVVISGLARGVDAEAHRGALEAGGITVAVQGRGPDDVYPASHRLLAERIAERGAVVSELPPGAPPRGGHFPLRNRIIAALAECVVVVEARARSGSLSTARHALDQGGEVLAVPGPITAATSVGTNRLLAQGATPFLDVDDVLQTLGLPLRRSGRQSPEAPESSAVVRALLDDPATPDELGRRLGRSPGELSEELLALELDGRVGLDRDGCLHVVRSGKTAPSQPLSSRPRREGGEID
ncbi:MAG: DNA-processing protein DprA [Myxococcota bacterium]